MDKIQSILLLTPVVVFSLVCHEYSHGRMALYFGDDTARRLGRLSFNPLRHLDPVGTLFFYFFGFGWAKPVPVDWRNFRNPRKDMMCVSAAGPLANIVLAFFCGLFIRIISPYDHPMVFYILSFGIFVNAGLAVFNLLPVFPLDGSGILKGLVPARLADRLSHLDRYFALFLVALLLLEQFAHVGILGRVLNVPIWTIVEMLTQERFQLVSEIMIRALN